MPVVCFGCGEKFPFESVQFNDDCLKCSASLHCCRNCEFYDESYSNFCRESSADRVLDKEKKNFCEFFKGIESSRQGGKSPKEDLRKAAEALFKK